MFNHFSPRTALPLILLVLLANCSSPKQQQKITAKPEQRTSAKPENKPATTAPAPTTTKTSPAPVVKKDAQPTTSQKNAPAQPQKAAPAQKLLDSVEKDRIYQEKTTTVQSSQQSTSQKRTKVKKAIPAPAELYRNIKELSFDELSKLKDYSVATADKDLTIKVLEQMLTSSTDQSKLKELRLELADYYFEKGTINKAGKHYTNYITMYPGSDQREYAEYKSILCRFYATLDSDRDQTITKDTLRLTQEYLNKKEIYPTYVQDVSNIQRQCCLKLYESEMQIVQFYMTQEKYNSAQKRLDYVKSNYLVLLEEKAEEIIQTEINLAYAKGDPVALEEKKKELAAKHPDVVKKIVVAQGKKKTDYVSFF